MNAFTYDVGFNHSSSSLDENSTFSDLDHFQDPIDPLDYGCIDNSDALLLDESFVIYLHDCEDPSSLI